MTDRLDAGSPEPNKDEAKTSYGRTTSTTPSPEHDLTQQLLSLTDNIRDRVEEAREFMERMKREEAEQRIRKSEREERMKNLFTGMANVQKSKVSSGQEANGAPRAVERGELSTNKKIRQTAGIR